MSNDELLKIIGTRIRSLRKAQKMTQERLAELSELHPTYVSQIEHGKVNPSICTCYAIARAMGVPLSQLVDLPNDD